MLLEQEYCRVRANLQFMRADFWATIGKIRLPFIPTSGHTGHGAPW